jgi:hypothetical protein
MEGSGLERMCVEDPGAPLELGPLFSPQVLFGPQPQPVEASILKVCGEGLFKPGE